MSKKSFIIEPGVINLTHPSFVEVLRDADLGSFPEQDKLNSPLDQALWMLWVIQDHFAHHQHIGAHEISELLEIREIALTSLHVERALARAGRRVSRKKIEGNGSGKSLYKIMKAGKDYLRGKYPPIGLRCIAFIDGNKPWTDRHVAFAEIAKGLHGRICVLDKFYGHESFGTLYHLRHARVLQFLTAKTYDNHAAFLRELKDFKKECPALEIRIYPNANELHDRYILTEDSVVIVGHGIKDLGNKESFVLVLKGEMGADMRELLQEKFDERWAKSSPLT